MESDYGSEADGAERVLRVAEGTPDGRIWPDLMAKHLKYPGVLAARSLQKMEWACGRNSANRGTYDHRRAPPEAINYYLAHLQKESAGNPRSLREAKMLCAMLDHCAAGRFLSGFWRLDLGSTKIKVSGVSRLVDFS